MILKMRKWNENVPMWPWLIQKMPYKKTFFNVSSYTA